MVLVLMRILVLILRVHQWMSTRLGLFRLSFQFSRSRTRSFFL